jgi:hypothetical protein
MATQKEIREENRKLRQVRLLADLTCSMLIQADITIPEMLNLVSATKKKILELFPDKESTFDLIYKPRFNRIIQERLNSN